MSKLRPTSFDYLVMALNPALVMILVGSLVFFLIEVSYEGEFQVRLCFIMSCFVLATVGITRIAIELDAARASLYGLVLSGAMLFVAPSFAAVPIPLLILLLAVIWYSAHRLTWDCTLIDEEQDASGEGLLQRIGLDAAPSEAAHDAAVAKPPFWKRVFAPDKSKHAPGLTVVYFSLAALPIFGLLQGFIPTSDTEGRGRAFLCLIAYVGAGLGLLLTTSLLGLRRYLRQRQVEMPAEMTATWIAVGAALIGIVLVLSTILPRSAHELQLGKSPITFTSGDQTARRGGWGKEGAKGDQQLGQADNKKEQNPSGDPGEREQQGGKPDPNAKQSDQSDGDDKQGNSKQAQGDAKGKGANPNQKGQDDQSDSETSESQDDRNGNSNERKNGQENGPDRDDQGNQARQNNDPNRQPKQRDQDQQQNQPNGPARNQNQQANENGPRREGNSASPSQPVKFNFDPTATVPFLSWLLKVLVLAAIAIGLLYCAVRYRREFFSGLRQLFAEIANLWRRLFGGASAAEAAIDETSIVREKRFSELTNPFRRGGGGLESRVLVQQTFSALEAWARDHGIPREKEQTAHEFADALSRRVSELATESKWLADCYSRAAYSSEEVSAQSQSSLAAVWQRMEQLYGRIPPAPPLT
jgi:hypothetical protein